MSSPQEIFQRLNDNKSLPLGDMDHNIVADFHLTLAPKEIIDPPVPSELSDLERKVYHILEPQWQLTEAIIKEIGPVMTVRSTVYQALRSLLAKNLVRVSHNSRGVPLWAVR